MSPASDKAIFDYKLKDFCQVGDGAHASINRQDSGVMYLTSKNFKADGLNLSKVDYISEADFEKHFEKSRSALVKPRAGDVVFGIIGSIGTPYIVRKEDRFGLSSSVAILRPNEELDSRYLYYYMTSAPFQLAVEAIKSGVAQGFLSLEMIRNLPLIKFSISEQRRIAAILSAYDDLIENNKRRIALLEKMAEEIYREWFVRFRFPGYQTAEFEKGIPKDWSRVPINSILDFKSGFAFKSGTYVSDGKYGIVTIKNVHDGRFVKECTDSIDDLPSRLPKHCQIKDGDILMSLTGNVGRVCIAEGENLLLNQRVAILKPKVENQSHFIYWLFRQESLHTLSELISTGAAQQNLSPVKLGNQLIVYPDRELLEEYQAKVDPIMKLILGLRKQITVLEATKSRLLPRLISGKLQVESLDIQFPPSMSEDEAA